MKKSKKFVCSFGVSLLLLASFSKCFAATGKVNIEALRIRAQASKTSEVLDVAYEDDKVEIIGESGDWYKVKFNGNTGYASKEYITNQENNSSSTTNTTSNSATETNTAENTDNSAENSNTTNNTNDNTTNEENNSESENNSSTLENIEGTKVKIKSNTKMKILPTFSSNDVSELSSGTEITVIYDLKNWIKVESSSKQGWIPKSLVTSDENTSNVSNESTEEQPTEENNSSSSSENTDNSRSEETSNVNKKGYINVETANVREKASTSSKLVSTLDEFDEVTIKSESDGWYEIEAGSVSGYISKKLVTIGTISSRGLAELRTTEETNSSIASQASETVEENTVTSDNSSEESSSSESSTSGEEVVEYAKQFLGLNYVLGGKSPSTGFDCSGFTKYVFKHFGYTLGSVAADQTSSGTEIDREDLEAGDLILFYDEGKTKIGHVGIYMGDDQFIHAANPKRGVVTDALSTNSYYNTRYVTARRIVE